MPELKSLSLFVLAVASSVLLLRSRRRDGEDDSSGRPTGEDGAYGNGEKKKQATSKYITPTKLDTDLDDGNTGSMAEKSVRDKKDKTLKDSVKPYDRHILVFGAGSAESWPGHIDDPSSATSPMARRNALGLTADMIRMVKAHNKALASTGKPHINVTITCSSEPVSKNCELGYYEAVMYPEALIFQVAPSNLPRFVEMACHVKRNMVDMLDKSIFKSVPTPWKYLICVCAHEQRDKRCGRAGPQVIERILSVLSSGSGSGSGRAVGVDGDVKVVATSHIGGHAFAGTLIVYPIAHWYGQVAARGDSVEKILTEVFKGGCYEHCHRGTGALVTW